MPTSGFDGRPYTQFRPQHNAEFFKGVLHKAGLQEGSVIADVGAGNGNSTIPLLELGYKVIAIEYEPSMIAELKAAVADKPYAGNLYIIPQKLEAVTAEHMQAAMNALGRNKADKADAIFAASALHWLDRKVALPKLREDILKPGGRIIGISRLMDPADSAVAELHALLLAVNVPGYKESETTFSPERWSNVEKQAARYFEPDFRIKILPEQRVFNSFPEFKGYLQTVSSLRKWLGSMSADSTPLQKLRTFYDAHAQEGVLTLPWKYVACVGAIQSRTITDPFPPPVKHP